MHPYVLLKTVFVLNWLVLSCATESANNYAGEQKLSAPVNPLVPDSSEKHREKLETLTLRVDSAIIREDFTEWKEYLSDTYLKAFSHTEIISLVNQSPRMRHSVFRIHNLEDFFRFVVIPSRKNVEWLDIELENGENAVVYAIMDGMKVMVYEFELYGSEWKLNLPHITNGHFPIIR